MLALVCPSLSNADDNPWARATTPKAGAARAIGGYSAGCIAGAVALPEGKHAFRIARPERRRVFGHPLLIAFLRALAGKVVKLGFGPLWLGDLGQPRGGPAPSGHASHQTGLDVDVFYARDHGEAVSMVDLEKHRPTRRLTKTVERVIREAASDARVERVFVNPVIKRELCAHAGSDREWLRKVRPWWGHHDHFHVRLPCPADSSECTAQEPLGPGDGCGDLAWWFGPEAEADRTRERQKYQSKVGALPQLPEPCKQVLDENNEIPRSVP